MRPVVAESALPPALLMRSLAGLLLAFGCTTQEEAPTTPPPPAPASADAIPAGPLGGNIAGAPFSVRSGLYRIDRRHGYEKIDISLSELDSTCDTHGSSSGTSVWLRRHGPGPLVPEQVRIGTEGHERWEVHYQRRERHRWLGNGKASAFVVIRAVAPDLRISGELWACFEDAKSSCVSGRFTAAYCPIRIDQPVRGGDTFERLPKEQRLPKTDGSPRDAGGEGGAP